MFSYLTYIGHNALNTFVIDSIIVLEIEFNVH